MKNKTIKFFTCYTIICCGLLIPYSAHAVVFSAIIAFYKILLGETHALAISVKQAAVSANQIIRMENQAKKTLSESIKVIQQSERVAKTLINYGAKTGQPLSTQCSSLLETQAIVSKQQLSNNNNFIDMQDYSTTITSDASKNVEDILQNTHSEYCSPEEQKSGICKEVNKSKQANDTNFSNTFSKDSLNDDEAKTANAYTKKVIQPKIDVASQCKTANCHASGSEELQYNAFLSMASYSLNGQISQRKINTD